MNERRYDIDWLRIVPLFMVLSGAGSWYALKSRTGGQAVTCGSEAQLPFYIFHQTVILCVVWFVIRWNIGMIPKYVIIVVVSFILIMALYELIVRRFNVMRFLFGIRPKKQPSTTE